jgi:hypothetical protein
LIGTIVEVQSDDTYRVNKDGITYSHNIDNIYLVRD